MNDDLILIVNKMQVKGWDSIRVTRGIERCPNDFDILMTERYPGETDALLLKAGDPCQVRLGDDLVITGYIDRVIYSVSKDRRNVRVVGRGKCQDLVDCAAQWPNGQILNCSVLQIASKMAGYNDIQVSTFNDGDRSAGKVPQFNLMLSETAWDVIERMCRFFQLLPYEGTDGNLVLAGVGTETAASGFQDGVNVQEATTTFSQDQRYSEYIAFLQSVDLFTDIGNGMKPVGIYKDEGVLRPRRHVTIAESGGMGQEVAKMRAEWEAARRYGRSQQVSLTTDSWRDSAGALYAPNTFVQLSLPSVKVDGKKWLISEVTYHLKEGSGTTCNLTMMPPEAFNPQPVLLQMFRPDIVAPTQP